MLEIAAEGVRLLAPAAVLLLLLAFLGSLSDVPATSAAVAFDHAQQIYASGYLEDAQGEADRGYRRFVQTDAGWARKFQLLEVRSMIARALDQDALKLLGDDRIPWATAEDRLNRSLWEGWALTQLHHLGEAKRKLAEAERLCAGSCASYQGVLRANAFLLLERGQTSEAKRVLLTNLELARASKDGAMESSTLLTLGRIASQQERHDEALELYLAAYRRAVEVGNQSNAETALADQGWEQYQLGNLDKALAMYEEAERHSAAVGNTGNQIRWLSLKALIYKGQRQLDKAEAADLKAIRLAEPIGQQQAVIDAAMDLATIYVDLGKPDQADRYAGQAEAMAQQTGSEVDLLNANLIKGRAAALRRDWRRAETLLHTVNDAAASQPSMKLDAENGLGNLYEEQGQTAAAESWYKAALLSVETARAELTQEDSQLNFLFNAARIYDDYIHFLLAQGRTEEALEAADWSRARTLQQGLGLVSATAVTSPPRFRATEIARKADATLLFYWLGAKQSYLWAISGEKTVLLPLPPGSEIAPLIERYRHALLNLKDPLKDGNEDGRRLYEMLVAPAQAMLPPGHGVVLFADGEMSQMNFETLVAGTGGGDEAGGNKAGGDKAGVGRAGPHYWIEDATIESARSIRMFGAAKATSKAGGKLLLIGDSVTAGSGFPELPMAALEVQKLRAHPSVSAGDVFTRERATPEAYLKSRPEQFAYIHFVSHGTASSTDPLESAVILSRNSAGGDSYKLYAREILRHPIDARLVTISACNSSGTKAVAGEGLVGLSWAFLRAGAHNAIGSLWEVSDASTPELMDRMYSGLEAGETPAEALRDAKLAMLHTGGNYGKPFYWATFQLYAGR